MEQVDIATFRKNPAAYGVPVEVTRYGRPVGRWVPVGADDPGPGKSPSPEADAAFTAYRPAPKPVKRK